MPLPKIFRRVFSGSEESVDSGCYDVPTGIGIFIKSSVGSFILKIGLQLDEQTLNVRIKKSDLTSIDGCAAGTSRDFIDGLQSDDDAVVRVGVKVNEVYSESFSHGFGLRNEDIIISVNDRQVHSTAMVSNMIHRIIKCSKYSKLRMEIYRKEKGLIILDNGGDDVSAQDDEELMLSPVNGTKETNVTIRHVESTKDLTVLSKSGKLTLSHFLRTKQYQKIFTVRHYAKVIGDGNEEKYITLQHKATKRYVYVENGNISTKLEAPPNGTLGLDSEYVIKIKDDSMSNEIFQPVNEIGKAIGFKRYARYRDSAELLPASSDYVKLTPFLS